MYNNSDYVCIIIIKQNNNLHVHVPTGVFIEWGSTVYTVSEDSGTVQLKLLKLGNISSDIQLHVTTLASTATGRSTCTCSFIDVYIHLYMQLCT